MRSTGKSKDQRTVVESNSGNARYGPSGTPDVAKVTLRSVVLASMLTWLAGSNNPSAHADAASTVAPACRKACAIPRDCVTSKPCSALRRVGLGPPLFASYVKRNAVGQGPPYSRLEPTQRCRSKMP